MCSLCEAAVSGAAKIISQHGGFTSAYSGNIMVCQVQLLDVPNIDRAVKVLLEKENQIIEHGNMFVSESMRKRGGGVVKIIPRMCNDYSIEINRNYPVR